MPSDTAAQARRRADVRERHLNRDRAVAQRFRAKLKEFYGPERAAKVQFAEAFEICEYGTRPDAAELRRLFPFFGP